jgi:hypothetical protein
MTKYRERRGLMSRLPEDEAYWAALTERLVADAADPLHAYRSATTRWWRGLTRLSTPLTIGAAAAVIAALLWLSDMPGGSPGSTSAATAYGFTPNDPLAVLFVTSPAAPTMATVIATSTSERAR